MKMDTQICADKFTSKQLQKAQTVGMKKISLLQLVSTVFCLCLIRIRVSTSKMLIPDPD